MPRKYPSVGFLNCPVSVYRRPELNLKGRSEEPKTTPEGGTWRPKPCWFGLGGYGGQFNCYAFKPPGQVEVLSEPGPESEEIQMQFTLFTLVGQSTYAGVV